MTLKRRMQTRHVPDMDQRIRVRAFSNPHLVHDSAAVRIICCRGCAFDIQSQKSAYACSTLDLQTWWEPVDLRAVLTRFRHNSSFVGLPPTADATACTYPGAHKHACMWITVPIRWKERKAQRRSACFALGSTLEKGWPVVAANLPTGLVQETKETVMVLARKLSATKTTVVRYGVWWH